MVWHLKEHWEWRVESSFAGLFQFVISLSDFFLGFEWFNWLVQDHHWFPHLDYMSKVGQSHSLSYMYGFGFVWHYFALVQMTFLRPPFIFIDIQGLLGQEHIPKLKKNTKTWDHMKELSEKSKSSALTLKVLSWEHISMVLRNF